MIKFAVRVEFYLGEIVHLKNDPEEIPSRIVTNYNVSSNGVLYGLSFGGGLTWHYANEINSDQTEERVFGFRQEILSVG